jgi:hypothetical protein
MTTNEISKSTTIGQMIIKSKEKLANRIRSLLIHVYGDAKKLTLSAYSYPMRIITSELSAKFKFNNFGEVTMMDTMIFNI